MVLFQELVLLEVQVAVVQVVTEETLIILLQTSTLEHKQEMQELLVQHQAQVVAVAEAAEAVLEMDQTMGLDTLEQAEQAEQALLDR
jgi:hypothetical protein